MIFDNSKRANKLIKDFLEFIKFLRTEVLNREPVNVNELVTSMWNIAKLDEGNKVRFRGRLNEIPEVLGDIEKLERVFLNLLLNAIQAVAEGGRIVVQTSYLPLEGMVEVNIIDDGPGIPERYREKVFEPFFTTKEDGTGLGLSICHSILQQHGGTIEIDCRDRKGTKVSVKLPAIPGLKKEESSAQESCEDAKMALTP